MTPLTLFLLVAGLCLIVLVVALLPLISQLKQTAASADQLISKMNDELEPLSRTLTETSEEINILVGSINDKVEQTDSVIDHVKEASEIVLHTSYLLQEKISPMLINLASLNAGLKTFMQFFKR